MQVEPMEASLGACVADVHLADLTDGEWQEIHAAFLQYGVLAFPEQKLTQSEQVAFGSRFGELLVPRLCSRGSRSEHPGLPRVTDGVIEMSNVDVEGTGHQRPGRSSGPVSGRKRCVAHRQLLRPGVGQGVAFSAASNARPRAGRPRSRHARRPGSALAVGPGSPAGLRAFHSLEYSQALRGVEGAAVPADPTTLPGRGMPSSAGIRRPAGSRSTSDVTPAPSRVWSLTAAQKLLADLLEASLPATQGRRPQMERR